MKYYPICLRVEGRSCIVFGGGTVAERKVESLLSAGAEVTVVSPKLGAGLTFLVERGRVRYTCRRGEANDLQGNVLAFAATNDEEFHRELAEEADRLGIPLNVVDRTEHCNFIVPAVLARGDLLVSVSTSGASPAFAGQIRDDIGELLGPEYDRALEVFARLRESIEGGKLDFTDRQRLFRELMASDLIESLREPDPERADAILAKYAGAGCSLASLGVDVSRWT